MLERLAAAKLVRRQTVGDDATTLEVNAAMRTIKPCETGEDYEAFVKRLAATPGMETLTRADLVRFDRKRKNKKTSNKEWMKPHDPDAKITKMKDGRTHLAYKMEEAVYLETAAVVAVAGAELRDSKTMTATLKMSREEDEAGAEMSGLGNRGGRGNIAETRSRK